MQGVSGPGWTDSFQGKLGDKRVPVSATVAPAVQKPGTVHDFLTGFQDAAVEGFKDMEEDLVEVGQDGIF